MKSGWGFRKVMLYSQKFYYIKLNPPVIMTENLFKGQVCIQQASIGQHTQLAAAVATSTVSY